MNTEQVVEMIDAITEGKIFATTFDGRGLKGNPSGQMTIAVGNSGFGFNVSGCLFDVKDPRTAREIAAALIAWANRKDEMVKGSARAILGDIRWSETKIQDEFERLHQTLKETPDTPENKEKLQQLLDQIQYLRENGAKDFIPEEDS